MHWESRICKEVHIYIGKACRHLKRGKAGLDGVTSEHIRYGGKPVVMALKALFNLVLDIETCPNDWKQSIKVNIHTFP